MVTRKYGQAAESMPEMQKSVLGYAKTERKE